MYSYFTRRSAVRVEEMPELREDVVVDKVTSLLGLRKDDAAVLSLEETSLVVNVDSFESGIHLYPFLPPRIAGRRAAVGSISDVLVKGAKPLGILVSLRVPSTADLGFLEEFYRGLLEAGTRFGARILGGDTDVSSTCYLRVDVVAIGVSRGKVLHRWGAKPGELVAITGRVGISSVLYALSSGGALSCNPGNSLVEEYGWGQLPEPATWLGIKELLTSAIDNSDGLALSLYYLAESSGVGIVVEELPVHAVAKECLPRERLVDAVLYASGEDYNFIFTFPEEAEEEVRKTGATIIGRVTEGEGVFLSDGRRVERKGWIGGPGYSPRL